MTERASGSDIIETQRTIIVPQKNGTDKKTVVKYQMAKIRQGQDKIQIHPWLTQHVLVLPFQLDLASDIFRQVSYS